MFWRGHAVVVSRWMFRRDDYTKRCSAHAMIWPAKCSWSLCREGALLRVRMVTSIRLMGLVAASLLLCSAQSFQPAPKLYRAKPQDVPPWAEQGNFRFIQLDGGRIESLRRARRHHGYQPWGCQRYVSRCSHTLTLPFVRVDLQHQQRRKILQPGAACSFPAVAR